MNLIKNIFLFLLILFLHLHAQTGIKVPEMVGVDSTIKKFMDDWNVPGASVAISKEGRLVYARGFGYADENMEEELLPSHQFRIASVSKPITSVAILKLMEQNKVNLDDKVFGSEGILNDSIYSSIRDDRVKDITIKDLLQHTGGWDRNIGGDPMFQSLSIAAKMNVPPPPDQKVIIEYMLRYNLDFSPGTQYAYSNFGYSVLGQVIEKISGMNYEDFITKNIFETIEAYDMILGKNLLENAAENEVYYNDYDGAPLAKSIYGNGELVKNPYGGFDIEVMDSHGGWVGTATDLIRFVLAVDGFTSRPDILSPSTINIMRTPSDVNPNYAKGWAVNNLGNWWHFGSLPGSTALLVRTSSGQICWSILLNYRPENFNVFNEQLDNMMWEAVSTISTWPEHDLFDSLTVINNDEASGKTFRLYQNYPNPFNSTTQIAYNLNSPEHIMISVNNILGEQIEILKDEYQPSGHHQIKWDTSSLGTGVYFIELRASKKREFIKAMLIK